MRTVRFSPAADADLAGIWRYSAANWGVAQANNYVLELREVCGGLAQDRTIGRRTLLTDLFKIRSGAHMIYYRMKPERIDIIRILHGKQDVERHLQP